MKALYGLILLLLSFSASAEYDLTIRFPNDGEAIIFPSCEMHLYSHSPGEPDGSYLYMGCTGSSHDLPGSSGAWSKPYAGFDEVGIGWLNDVGGTGYIERHDCFMVYFVHEEHANDDKGHMTIECGNMHQPIFGNGFEGD